jgi:hypothetical protein
VQEYASPNFHDPGQVGLLLIVLVLALVLVLGRHPWTPTEILLTLGFGYFALHSMRNVPSFALVVAPIIAGKVNLPLPRPRTVAGGGLWVPVTLLAVLALAPRVLPTGIPPARYPVEAVRVLRTSPDPVRGEMFNDLLWGGYFLLEMPDRKVFIDGRIDFYGERVIEDFKVVDGARPGWEEVAARHDVGWTILPSRHPLNAVLALHPKWSEAHRDSVAVIYTRRSP